MANRLTMFAHLSPAHLVLLIEMAEICRRSVWFVFRIEWEMVNTELKKQAAAQGRRSETNEEREMLLMKQ
jgi:hypothetical protein